MMNTKKQNNIAVIGAGPTTLYFIYTLLGEKIFPQKIAVFEQHDELGKGNPFRNANAMPHLLSNLKSSELPDLNISFETWLKSTNPPYLIGQTSDSVFSYNLDGETIETDVIPRKVLGDYFNYCFDKVVKALQQKGVEVCLHTHTTIRRITKLRTCFVVDTGSNTYSGFSHLVVNTGTDLCEHQKEEGVYSAYPPHLYATKASSQFYIAGMSLTAIDAALSIAKTKGRFYRHSGDIKYASDTAYTIVMHSRSGVFPKVWYNSDPVARYQKQLQEIETPQVSGVESFYRHRLLPVFRKAMPNIYKQIEFMSFVDAMAFLNQRTNETDPILKLKAELFSLDSDTVQSDWPAIIAAGINCIQQTPLLLQDFLTHYQDIKPHFSASVASIPPDSANRLIALYDSGNLRITKSDSIDAEPRHHPDTIKIDATGVLGDKDKLAKLRELIVFDSETLNEGETHVDKVKIQESTDSEEYELSIADTHELLRNSLPTRVFVGSAFATPWYINVPGLDTCASFAKTIALGCLDSSNYEEAVGE
ncbi:hypothetical protein GTH32_15435 [Alteromonas sp. 345S023]|uniref:FAD-dependent urate hydroxylase HpyO/Asp monooxygenase CreE-like FAD/NAD(P)-binding domain-containing protein n=1 Tax=Alteromonas profundi TaxID=2696062 RepID=A0A7X5RMA5_9ALTE|nr:FAD/NAD(P)-binding protein [Alteromonas profundi]NDV92566.1 hypothetical protein [Alteromonas profundi]